MGLQHGNCTIKEHITNNYKITIGVLLDLDQTVCRTCWRGFSFGCGLSKMLLPKKVFSRTEAHACQHHLSYLCHPLLSSLPLFLPSFFSIIFFFKREILMSGMGSRYTELEIEKVFLFCL